jgi:hypothetical protein
MAYRLGIDIGGTFTDFALMDKEDGSLSLYKELTTPEDRPKPSFEAPPRSCTSDNTVGCTTHDRATLWQARSREHPISCSEGGRTERCHLPL